MILSFLSYSADDILLEEGFSKSSDLTVSPCNDSLVNKLTLLHATAGVSFWSLKVVPALQKSAAFQRRARIQNWTIAQKSRREDNSPLSHPSLRTQAYYLVSNSILNTNVLTVFCLPCCTPSFPWQSDSYSMKKSLTMYSFAHFRISWPRSQPCGLVFPVTWKGLLIQLFII